MHGMISPTSRSSLQMLVSNLEKFILGEYFLQAIHHRTHISTVILRSRTQSFVGLKFLRRLTFIVYMSVNVFELIVRGLPRERMILTTWDEKSSKCFPTILDWTVRCVINRNILYIRKILLTIGLPGATHLRRDLHTRFFIPLCELSFIVCTPRVDFICCGHAEAEICSAWRECDFF